jgi:hypothetical protein
MVIAAERFPFVNRAASRGSVYGILRGQVFEKQIVIALAKRDCLRVA